jgi:hypothetical protein
MGDDQGRSKTRWSAKYFHTVVGALRSAKGRFSASQRRKQRGMGAPAEANPLILPKGGASFPIGAPAISMTYVALYFRARFLQIRAARRSPSIAAGSTGKLQE